MILHSDTYLITKLDGSVQRFVAADPLSNYWAVDIENAIVFGSVLDAQLYWRGLDPVFKDAIEGDADVVRVVLEGMAPAE